jgi:Arc/MetJ-type ribon-helix-helix transcriptional regulator
MTTQIALRITDEDLAELDAAIALGSFRNRSAALRAGLDLVLREERERPIDDVYRRGYGEHPQEAWLGTDGLVLFHALATNEATEASPL